MRFLMICCILITHQLYSQYSNNVVKNRTLQFSDSKKWRSVENALVSNNGKYFFYLIKNKPLGQETGIIQSINREWKYELPGVDKIAFSFNSEYALYLQRDTLWLINLNNKSKNSMPNIEFFRLVSYPEGEWLVYKLEGHLGEIVIQDISSFAEKFKRNIDRFWFSRDGGSMIFETKSEKDTSDIFNLTWLNLEKNYEKKIWEGAKVAELYFDDASTQIAFTVKSKQNSTSIWHCKSTMQSAVQLVDDSLLDKSKSLKIERIFYYGFSKDGRRLFFTIQDRDFINVNKSSDLIAVDVWSYKDLKLQSQQLSEINSKSYWAVISLDSPSCIQRLNYENESFSSPDQNINIDKYGVMWNEARMLERSSVDPDSAIGYIISTKDGAKEFPIKRNYRSITISPEAKYVVYFDVREQNYFSYELASGVLRNITKQVFTKWSTYGADNVVSSGMPPAGWVKGDSAIFLYDQTDIWKVDPKAHIPPLNWTNGFGKRHNYLFRFLLDQTSTIYHDNESIILSAFNTQNKENGFFSKVANETGDPDSLSMGPYIYYMPVHSLGITPIKAKASRIWIVKRMSVKESPNYFQTTDFRNFHRLSDVAPEKEYTWMTSELCTWKFNDSKLEGILYKPTNFDPSKRYPVIFHIYEKRSHRLNAYLEPKLSNGDLNIPWYVSNGYLVFEPDIHYKIGLPGECALNSVVSAIKYLSRFSFIDQKRIALQGISFGGFEANYIITHTKLFAAVCSASGGTNFISYYGSLISNSISQHEQFESGQYRIGYTLWEKPELYLKNSPVLRADQVATPFLMMATKKDGVVPFTQAVEFFTALRRLQKIAWMLQYDDGNHGVSGRSSEDFTIRMAQFFNHYLKESPAPVWMTKGVPAKFKGIKIGYNLDPSGCCGKLCKVCKKWNQQYKYTPEMFQKEESEWKLDQSRQDVTPRR